MMRMSSLSSSLTLLIVVLFSPLVVVLSVPSSSRSLLSQSAGTSKLYDFDHNGVPRHYKLYLPKGYTSSSAASYPLLFMFHGWSGDEDDFLSYDIVRTKADELGFVLVCPRGLGSGAPDDSYNSWTFTGSSTGVDETGGSICDVSRQETNNNYASCVTSGEALNLCAWTQCQDDDVSFVMSLLSHLSSAIEVDVSNVFATGGSNGGMFTWHVGQSSVSAPSFRAIAPIIGVPHANNLHVQGRSLPLPVLLIMGKNDLTVPPGEWDNWSEEESWTTTSDGDFYYYTGASAITRAWSEEASSKGLCEITGDKAVSFDEGRGTKADCRSFCKMNTEGEWPIVLDCRYNKGHDYNTDEAFPLIMDFFEYHKNKGGGGGEGEGEGEDDTGGSEATKAGVLYTMAAGIALGLLLNSQQ